MVPPLCTFAGPGRLPNEAVKLAKKAIRNGETKVPKNQTMAPWPAERGPKTNCEGPNFVVADCFPF